jgi:hypothetical protein
MMPAKGGTGGTGVHSLGQNRLQRGYYQAWLINAKISLPAYIYNLYLYLSPYVRQKRQPPWGVRTRVPPTSKGKHAEKQPT